MFRSEGSLDTVHKRIFFGLFLSNCILSCVLTIGPLVLVPNKDSLTGIGNHITCKIQGILTIGSMFLSLSYTFGLCFYHLKMVKDHMSERQFKKKLEKKLHIAALIFPIIMIVMAVTALEIDPSTQGPVVCSAFPDKNLKRKIVPGLIGISFLSGFVGMIMLTVKLFLAVRALERRMALRYRSSITLRRGSSTLIGITEAAVIAIDEEDDTNTNTNTNQSTNPVSAPSADSKLRALHLKSSRRVHLFKQRIWMTITCRLSLLDDRVNVPLTRSQMTSRARTRKVLVQTVLYIAVFIITSIWPIVITVGFLSRGVAPPVALDIISKCLYPSNGILLLLVFTRSKVATVLERWEGYSRARAFWVVVKAGFEVPSNCVKIESDEENAQNIREPNAVADAPHEASEDTKTYVANFPISGMPTNVVTVVDLKIPIAAAMPLPTSDDIDQELSSSKERVDS